LLKAAASADDKNNRGDRSKTISNYLQRFFRGPTASKTERNNRKK
jgi:hypothetical protein